MRIVSLVPAATEMVAFLGKLDELVGVSHECDYPAEVSALPKVTKCVIPTADLTSREIDNRVRETVAAVGSLYQLDAELLRQLEPDIILTQQLCDVCAIGWGTVQAFAATLPRPPKVVNLEPTCLTDILQCLLTVSELWGSTERERVGELVALLNRRVETVRLRAIPTTDQRSTPNGIGEPPRRPTCLFLEWLDPPYSSGHWGPELIELAGGIDPIGRPGSASVPLEWDQVLSSQADVVVLGCCGYPRARTLIDYEPLRQRPGWRALPAVRKGRVYVVDGNAYFNRPGPRIVDSLEILAEILHPDRFTGWSHEIQVIDDD